VNRIIAVLMATTGFACGGGHLPEAPAGTSVSYASHVEALVLKRCVGCHTAEEPRADLVLERGVGFERMVGPISKQAPTMRMVVPGDLEASYLWLKLDQRPIKGEGMPRTLLGAKRLPERELERFRRWIEDGALP